MNKSWKFLSGSALKWIAIITMFLDHIGASLIEVYIFNYYGSAPYTGFAQLSAEQMGFWYLLDTGLRCVGRIAFPIFCFLLVEGFMHTKNVKKYALRLGLFCVLSEIPFDLAFHGTVYYPAYQNVFFTLLLGLLAVWGMEYLRRCFDGIGGFLLGLPVLALCAFGAEALKTDYGAFGVMVIAAFYFGYQKPVLRSLAVAALLLYYGGIERLGILALLPILFYNGQRGKQPKYFFYVFYPVHLLLFALIGMYLIPAIL